MRGGYSHMSVDIDCLRVIYTTERSMISGCWWFVDLCHLPTGGALLPGYFLEYVELRIRSYFAAE